VNEKRLNAVHILYASFDKRLTEDSWEKFFCAFPIGTQTKIMRFRRWEDRHARLLGNLLLMAFLKMNGCEDASDMLGNISTSEHGRPFLEKGIDFNISHSGQYVVCAASRDVRLGIDIERMKGIEVSDFKESFTPFEWDEIRKALDALAAFYRCWTAKESVVKADGRGLAIPLQTIDIVGNRAKVQGKTWFLKEIGIDPGYCCHLALSEEACDIKVMEIRV